MRPGLFLSILLHIGIFGSAYIVFPMASTTTSEEIIIVPIELVTVSDTTNLAYSNPEEPEKVPDPEPEPEPTPEETPEPPAEEAEPEEEIDPRAEDDAGDEVSEPEPEEVVPEEVEDTPPEPEPEETPEPEPEPTPTPKVIPPEEEKKPPSDDLFNDILKDLDSKKKERKRQFETAPDLKQVENANKNKRSAGDRMRDTATWNSLLKSKLVGCFRDPSDMADADRLNVTYKITFQKDGTLMRAPRRVQPAQIPMGDQQLRVFDINAQRAIEKCAPYDDIFPPELYDEWKDFTFVFGKN